ncbi:MAG TPA: hypothetical protein PLW66_01475 [Saprospiraceae bacterium]|nr:hypothetical protein [Saprospiraceae bacterium]
METTVFFSFLAILAFQVCSCGQAQQTDRHSVFSQLPPDNPVYKAELARQIRTMGAGRLDYRVEAYAERNNEDFLLVRVQGEGLDAIAEMNVPEWQKLGKIRENKGLGYRGAYLAGLRFDILDEAQDVRFVFRDLDRIVD